jgi:hypothetical protein
MIRYLLGKPFEWLMRIFYKVHLAIDGNSEWYVLNQGELDTIVDEVLEGELFSIADYAFDDVDDSEFICECGH